MSKYSARIIGRVAIDMALITISVGKLIKNYRITHSKALQVFPPRDTFFSEIKTHNDDYSGFVTKTNLNISLTK